MNHKDEGKEKRGKRDSFTRMKLTFVWISREWMDKERGLYGLILDL